MQINFRMIIAISALLAGTTSFADGNQAPPPQQPPPQQQQPPPPQQQPPPQQELSPDFDQYGDWQDSLPLFNPQIYYYCDYYGPAPCGIYNGLYPYPRFAYGRGWARQWWGTWGGYIRPPVAVPYGGGYNGGGVIVRRGGGYYGGGAAVGGGGYYGGGQMGPRPTPYYGGGSGFRGGFRR